MLRGYTPLRYTGATECAFRTAKDFGVHEGTIAKWLRQAETDAGNKPGNTTDESAELREMRRRNRLLE